MNIGKVPNSVLQEIILNKIKHTRKEVLLTPKIGEDCCAVDFGEHICVLSTDPITGAVNDVGRLAVHVSCNDIASCGVEPIGLLVNILAPPSVTENDLDVIMNQLCGTAGLLNVDIIGGHTEITDSVNRVVIIGTAVGKCLKDKMVTTSGAKVNDDIIITKSAGIEGTAIIASDFEDTLRSALGEESVRNAKSFINKISVVREGIIAGEFGVNSMHDVTEGGILGSVWEITAASNVGAVVFKDRIPIEKETEEICNYFAINPLKLISSGCMMITCQSGEKLVKELGRNNIKAEIIGKITADLTRILVDDNIREEITQPDSDELYRVLNCANRSTL
jgi:hydrogenase maturation factor